MSRIQSRAAADMTGLSVRAIQDMAARGDVPGAAKLGSRWTFDYDRLRALIAEREAACRISINVARRGGAASVLPAASIDAVYEHTLGLRRSGD